MTKNLSHIPPSVSSNPAVFIPEPQAGRANCGLTDDEPEFPCLLDLLEEPDHPEYCTQNGGDCSTCSLVNYGLDCQNNPIRNQEVRHD